jgi:hypothetical protein
VFNFFFQALYWETFFFSEEYKYQSFADNFLAEHPKLPRYLDMDHLLDRAVRYQQESFFRQLLEISLKFDLEEYEKIRALESLLVFQCKCFFENSFTKYMPLE